LYFADTRFPIERANGVQTMETCRALAARGHDIRLFVRPDTTTPPRDPFEFYGGPREPRLAIHAVAGQGGRSARARFLLGALAAVRNAPRAVVYTRDLGVAALLLQLPRPVRPPVVYESHGIAAVVRAELPDLLGRGAVAVPTPAKLHRLDRRERRVWQRAAAYVTITQALAGDLHARYGARDGVFVVPDGARPPVDEGVPRTGNGGNATDPATLVVGYAGHLYPWKGVDVLVQALARTPGVRGLIVGGHPREADRRRVEQLADRCGVRNRLDITGLVPPAEVALRLSAATVLVLPNTQSAISDRYTSPLKLFEYLWMERPIIASNLAAIREILVDGQTALLVSPGDPDALSAAIRNLCADRVLADRLASAARALAPSFTWEARAVRLEGALQTAAGRA
jgi:glycosyltransferase involved in cell wall biosynthesis